MLVAEHGIYRLASCTPDPHRWLWMAVLRTGGVLSHTTAARLLGSEQRQRQVEITTVRDHHPTNSPGVIVHRSRRLPAHHTTKDATGLPLTIAPRTLVDLAGQTTNTDEALLDTLDELIIARAIRINWLEWFLEKEATGLNGRRRLGKLVRRATDTPTDSLAERQLAKLLTRAGLIGFTTQHEITTAQGRRYRLDFAWPSAHLALELDGYRFHSAPGQFEEDRARGNEIELEGWQLLRTTPRAVRQRPEEVRALVERALDQTR